MKKNSLFLLASIAALLTSISSAQDNTSVEVIELPKYVVTAPRQTTVEKQLDRSLATLRAQASAETLASELPYVKAPALSQATLAQAAKDAQLSRVAKN
ncbi:hypothetical protein [Oleiharenicola lentus]|uniref:hypothetical protein n=1 Tax=Oleiharenicola lentus TaxID=2508720 RepID=UPI003F664541